MWICRARGVGDGGVMMCDMESPHADGFRSVFDGSSITYPQRRVTHEDNGDAKMGS